MPIKFWKADNTAMRSLKHIEEDFNKFEERVEIEKISIHVLASEPDSTELANTILWCYYKEKRIGEG